MDLTRSLIHGIDLHPNRFNSAVIRSNNDLVGRRTYPVSPAGLEAFKATLHEDDVVVVEATGNTFAFLDQIREKVRGVYVVNVRKWLEKRYGNKTDRIDALKLAKDLAYHLQTKESHLPLVYIPSGYVVELRSLFTTYKGFQAKKTAAICRIYSLLVSNLKTLDKGKIAGKRVRTEIKKMLGIRDSDRFQIELMYEEVEFYEKQMDRMEQKIKSYISHCQEEVRIMVSVTGMSILSALAMKADYADINRFENAKHFTSYLRAAPLVEASNETVVIKGVNRNSRKLSLTFIIQGINHFAMSTAPLRRFKEQKLKGKKSGVVRVAMARKMMTALYCMLKRKEIYRNVRQDIYRRKLKEIDSILKAA